MASFDRSIPPGGEGKITLRLNTRGYAGKLQKAVVVLTNDPKVPQEMLFIEGLIKTPIMVSDKIVSLRGASQEIIRKTVDIKGEINRLLKLDPIEYTLDNSVKFDVEEVVKGEHYRITFTRLPNAGDSCQGVLRLRTSYPEKPEIVIYVRGKFKK